MPIRQLDLSIVDGHSLLLVHDPDDILQDETLLAGLASLGYAVVRESDPVALRYEVQQARAQAGQRIAVITKHELERLPYDLWQQGQHVTLALSEYFPHLDYPTVKNLRPGQRRKLDEAYASKRPVRLLSPVETQDYLLREVFDVTPSMLARPASLLLWLTNLHQTGEPLPVALAERLLDQLSHVPAFEDWPLADMLTDRDACQSFVRSAWGTYVVHTLAEKPAQYKLRSGLDFGDDEDLQDALPRLVRAGMISTLISPRAVALPAWAQIGIAADDDTAWTRKLAEATTAVEETLEQVDLRWADWRGIAWRWAEAVCLNYNYDLNHPSYVRKQHERLSAELDRRFAAWLKDNYAPLATMQLPEPHHLFHVPGYLAHRRDPGQRIALLVMDGMSLADWLLIREMWTIHRPQWSFNEHLLLAQAPSITAVSRQALISGRRPAMFADSLTTSRSEAQLWSAFWQRHFESTAGIAYETLSDRANASYPSAAESRYTKALCMISPAIDAIVHGATQGTADVIASVKLWTHDDYRTGTGSSWFEELIVKLLDNDYLVTIASDHGHVEALGAGQPQEGVLVETRSKRARLYNNRDFARAVQEQHSGTILWEDDGLLPPGWQALMPSGRTAFAPAGQRVVSHGGLTIEEMVVPLITIETD